MGRCLYCCTALQLHPEPMARKSICLCLAMASVAGAFHFNAPISKQAVTKVEPKQQNAPGAVPLAPLVRKLVPTVTTLLGLSMPFAPLMQPPAAHADGSTTRFVLPPVDKADKGRCQFKSSAMGQANAARDKLYDLRMCDMSGQKADGFDLSGAIMGEASFIKTSFRDAILSKAYMKESNFENADFTNAVVDRVSFESANLKGAIFANAVLSGTSFNKADLTDADFTDSYMGEFDLKSLCRNPSLAGTNPVTGAPTKESAGCK